MTKVSQGRTQLVAEADRLFGMKGYGATSVNDIVQACGITKGSLYHHFEGKEALALAVLQQVHADFATGLFSRIQGQPRPRVVELASFNQAVETFCEEHPGGCLFANLAVEEDAPFKAQIRAFFAEWEDCYFKVFASYQPADIARIHAEDAVAAVQGCILIKRITGESVALVRLHQRLLELCR